MKITLDEIIPYQPHLPPKPSISSNIIPPPSKLLPFTHPLPQKPHSRHQSPSCLSRLLHQSRSHPIPSPINQESRVEVPLYPNTFDDELANWSDMAVGATAIVSAATENTGHHQQSQCRSGSKGIEIDLRKEPAGIQSENWQHGSQNGEASPGISAGFLEHERSCSVYQETAEPINGSQSNSMHSALSLNARSGKAIPVDTTHLDDVNLPHASSAAPDLTDSPDITLLTASVDNQDVLSEKRAPGPDTSPLDMILSESRETSLVVLNNEDNEDIPSSLEGEHPTTNTSLGRSQDPSLSSRGEQNGVCLAENNTVAVVIPTARPPKPRTRKSAKRHCRGRPKRQIPRRSPADESDGSDNSDDDGYVERTPHFDHAYRPTKKQRQLPITNSDRADMGAVGVFHLGNLSLPDLRTIPQGDLTCHINPSHIVYTLSWVEERQCPAHRSSEDYLPSRRYNRHNMNNPQEWDSYASSNDEPDQMPCNKQHHSQLSARKSFKRKKEWTREQDALLKQLREEDKLPWSQVQEHFPNRTEGAIKVRYYTIIKDSASMPCVSTSRAHSDRGGSFSPSPEPVLPNRTQHSLDIAVNPRRRSRPARARRAVIRYSP